MSTFSASIQADINNFEANIGKATQSIDKFSQNVGRQLDKVGDSFVSIGKKASVLSAALIAVGFSSFKMAADLEDAIGASDQIFKNSSKEIQKWAKNLSAQYGIAETEGLTLANTMGAMLKNIGKLSESEASKQAARLVELSGDLAAMFGGTSQDAARALIGALKGNNTMLDNYGMGVNDATVKTRAFELGLMDAKGEMSLQVKQAATLSLIMEQSADSLGQAGREAEGGSGSMRILTTTIKNLSTSLGEILLPIITPLITKVGDFVQKINDLDPKMKKIIVSIGLVGVAVGPMMLALGGLLKLLPLIGAGFTAMTGPVGIAITATAAISFALYELIKPLTKTNTVAKEVANSTQQLYQELGKEQIEIDKLFVAYKSANVGTEEHKRIKDEIISKYGQFLKNQVDEEGNIINIDDAYKQLNISLRDQIALKIKNQRLETISTSNINAQAKAITELTSKIDQSDRVKFGVRLNEEFRDFSNSAETDLDKLFDKLVTLTRDEFGIDLMKSDGFFKKIPFQSILKLINSMKEAEMQAQGVEIAFAGISDVVISPNAVTTVDVLNTSLENLDEALDNLGGKALIPEGSLKELSEKLKVLYEKLDNETTQSGRVKVSRLIADLENQIARIKVNIKFELDNKNLANDSGFDASPIFELKPLIEKKYEDLSEMKDKFDKEVAEIAQGVQFFDNMLVGGFVNIFEGLGSAIAGGGNILGSFSKTIIGTLGDMAVKVGTLVIGFGNAAKALHAAFTSVFGAAGAVVAGGALIVLGTAVKASISGAMNGGGGSSSGGASSTFRGGYDYNNLGQSEMKGAYATQDTVTFEIKGDTLVGILEKQSSKNNRLR